MENIHFNQENRLLQLDCEIESQLLPVRCQLLESVSADLTLLLDVVSSNLTLKSLKFIGHPIQLSIQNGQQPSHLVSGIITQCHAGNVHARQLRHYQLKVNSSLYNMRLSQHTQSFRHKNVLTITKELAAKNQIPTPDTSALQEKYPERLYTMQYNESDYDFWQRQLANSGIFYYIRHQDGIHDIVLSDKSSATPTMPITTQLANQHDNNGSFSTWQEDFSASTTEQEIGYICFAKGPTLQIHKSPLKKSNQSKPAKVLHSILNQRNYYYCGERRQDDLPNAQNRLDANFCLNHSIYTKSNYAFLTPGYQINHQHVEQDSKENTTEKYFVLSVCHHAYDPSGISDNQLYRWLDDQINTNSESLLDSQSINSTALNLPINALSEGHEMKNGSFYTNCAILVNSKISYKPKPLATPQLIGYQTAKVITPDDELIHTNDHAQVKAQLHCDHNRFDNPLATLPWLTTVYPSAGNGYGAQQIPRQNDEGMIYHQNGHPDYPIFCASLANSQQREAYTLPDQQNKSGIITHSLKKGSTKAHHLTFDDTPGEEKVDLYSAGKTDIEVLKTLTKTIDGAEKITIDSDTLTQVLSGATNIEAGKITLKVGACQLVMDKGGIHITGKTFLRASGVSATKPVACIGDHHSCPKILHSGGAILKGSQLTTAKGKPTATVNSKMHCRIKNDFIKKGVDSITINQMPIAIQGSKSKHGGHITKANNNVYVAPMKHFTNASGNANSSAKFFDTMSDIAKSSGKSNKSTATAETPLEENTNDPLVNNQQKILNKSTKIDNITFSNKQLQKKFKHAQDFGVTDNYNKESNEEFKQAILDHMYDDETIMKPGTYKQSQSVTHFFNPKTKMNVMVDDNNNFISGWKLEKDQLMNVSKRGSL